MKLETFILNSPSWSCCSQLSCDGPVSVVSPAGWNDAYHG